MSVLVLETCSNMELVAMLENKRQKFERKLGELTLSTNGNNTIQKNHCDTTEYLLNTIQQFLSNDCIKTMSLLLSDKQGLIRLLVAISNVLWMFLQKHASGGTFSFFVYFT